MTDPASADVRGGYETLLLKLPHIHIIVLEGYFAVVRVGNLMVLMFTFMRLQTPHILLFTNSRIIFCDGGSRG